LVKAYIKGGIITVSSGKQKISYTIGAGATSLGNKWDFKNPYALFTDYNEDELSKFATLEFKKLIELDNFSLDSLGELDNSRKVKQYLLKNLNITLEVIDDMVISCFSLSSAKDPFVLEILACAFSKKPLKICENCGKFFFPSGRADSVYCDRILDNGFSCKKIGAHRQYRKNSRANDIKKLYDKVTKHNRYLKSKGTMSAYEYNSWMSEASSKYADFKSGKLSHADFENWLLGKEIPTEKSRARSRSTISDYLL